MRPSFAALLAFAVLGCGGSTAARTPDGGTPVDATTDVEGDTPAPPPMDATTEASPGDAGGDGAADATAEAEAMDAAATDGPVLDSIVVAPDPLSLNISCDPGQMTATASYSDGTMVNVAAQAAWSSSDTTVATASPGGIITCAPFGTGGAVTISSSYQGVTGTSVAVCGGGKLVAVAIEPPDASEPTGGTVQFTATATLSSGATCEATHSASWQTASPTVATIATSGSFAGLATAHSVGSTLVEASLWGVQAPSVSLDVVAADGGTAADAGSVSTGVAIVPPNPTMPAGCTQQMAAIAQYADGTTTDATAASTWSSSAHSVAQVNAGGLVACVDPGTTTIGASYDGKTAQTTVTCTATVLTAVSVTPADASIAVGAAIQYAASGLFSSGQQCDVTQAAQWQSSAPSVASIVATSPDAGLATGLEAGTSQISAIASGLTGTTTLTVQ